MAQHDKDYQEDSQNEPRAHSFIVLWWLHFLSDIFFVRATYNTQPALDLDTETSESGSGPTSREYLCLH